MTISNQRSTIYNNNYFWLIISVIFAVYYGAVSCYYAFSQDYLVQDDARQHVVWLQRYIDSELFPNDIIADYFVNLAPLGYKSFYWLFARLGIEPIVLAKILPTFLGLTTTIYIYWFSLAIIPLPSCAFLSSLFINQLMWLNDDLISATPRAFLYPLFAAFLYYLTQEKISLCLLVMALQGLFYPQLLLIEITILSFRLIEYYPIIKLTRKTQPYIWWILGLIVTAIALYPLTQKTPELATVVTAPQMKQMPEFNLNGRSNFFGGSWLSYWFTGSSGLSLPWFPPIVWCGLALPFILKKSLPTIKLIKPKIIILWQIVGASLLMFVAAHILLPKLHLPSRYTYHSLRFYLAIASAIVITTLLDLFKSWRKKIEYKNKLKLSQKITILLVNIFAATVILFPLIPPVFIGWFQNWQVGKEREIYQYLAQQPKDIIVASLSPEVNNIPAFSQRSILVGGEFALAYHPDYHHLITQRTIALLQAQYSNNLSDLQKFINEYKIDYILIDKAAFTPEYLQQQNWLIYSSWQQTTRKIIAKLESGENSTIAHFILSCQAVSTEKLILLDTNCIDKSSDL
ncbi:MAG: hypothetical protein Tsb0014_31310 [Pleurocapsa sp.]